MKSLLQSCAFALAILTALGSQSSAGIFQGDFLESLDLPSVTGGPRVLFRSAALGTGFELTDADELDNPSSLQGYLLVDLDDNLLTLTSVGPVLDFQLVSVDISSIVFDTPGQFISGVMLVSPSLIDTGVNPTSPATERIMFTDNLINISWSVDDPYTPPIVPNPPATFSFFSDRTATYEISFGSANTVPEPGTMSIFGIGAIAMLLRARRQSRG